MKSQAIFNNCTHQISWSAKSAMGASDEEAIERIREIEALCRMARSALGAKSMEEEGGE